MNITEDFKQRLLQAAEKCPQAKETLKTLFPEVFEEEHDLVIDSSMDMPGISIKKGKHLLWTSVDKKRILLSMEFDWTINNNELKFTRKK